MLVSIIMPTFNRAKIVGRSIDSVIKQTHDNWELLVVDDASCDNTEEIVNSYRDKRIKYIRNDQNRGANYSRNRGIQASNGEYIALIDSDNVWKPTKLEEQLQIIELEEMDCGIVFCRERVVDGEKSYLVPNDQFDEDNLENIMIRQNVIDTSTVLIRIECFEKVGLFDENMPRLQDWEMFLRIIHKGKYRGKYLPEILNENYVMSDSITKNNKKYIIAIFYLIDKYWDVYYGQDILTPYIQSALQQAKTDEENAFVLQELTKLLQKHNDEVGRICFDLLKDQVKYKEYYNNIYKWKFADIHLKGSALRNYLESKGYRNIGLYGLGKCGEIVYHELKSDYNILFGLDWRATNFYDLKVYNNWHVKEEVDVIIISILSGADAIKNELARSFTCDIISIDKILDECHWESK